MILELEIFKVVGDWGGELLQRHLGYSNNMGFYFYVPEQPATCISYIQGSLVCISRTHQSQNVSLRSDR